MSSSSDALSAMADKLEVISSAISFHRKKLIDGGFSPEAAERMCEYLYSALVTMMDRAKAPTPADRPRR